jgi:flagellar hook-associated protein 1 FlgK
LFTTGGGILLEGRAAEISFTSVGVIVPEMTIGSGALSSVYVNGNDALAAGRNPLGGGSLGGLISVRDTLSTGVQSQLDAVARDLVERFSDPAVDPTLGPSDPGLFTDEGAAFLPANEIGLSSRLSINPAVDPAAGTLWKLRDGLMAVAPGPIGDNAGLLSLADALSSKRVPASGSFSSVARSSVGLASDFLSLVNTDLLSAKSNQTFSMAKFDTLKTMELQGGVDTDYEMQTLLLVEQAFSANARVISAVDEMINTLMGI